MKKIIFLFRRALDADFKRMLRRVGSIAKANHKWYPIVLIDMLFCTFKYQAGFEDYELFDFVNLSAEQRRTYMTSGINNTIVRNNNQKEYRKFFHEKTLFLDRFSEYVGRSWIDVSQADRDEFRAWVKGREKFLIKPIDGQCGGGIEVVQTNADEDTDRLYDKIRAGKSLLAEEYIEQDETMASLYNGSVNTIRIVTFYHKERKQPLILFASVRVGNGGVIDNLSSGGMSSIVDIEQGTILYPAADKSGTIYGTHPISKTAFQGFQIPYWQEIRSMILHAATEIPEIGYTGWDIAISKDGPVLVEANDHPGYDMYQMPGMIQNKTGILPLFQQRMK